MSERCFCRVKNPRLAFIFFRYFRGVSSLSSDFTASDKHFFFFFLSMMSSVSSFFFNVFSLSLLSNNLILMYLGVVFLSHTLEVWSVFLDL